MLNPSPQVRFVVYVVTGLAGIWLLFFAGSLSPELAKAIGATIVFVSGLAGYNVSK